MGAAPTKMMHAAQEGDVDVLRLLVERKKIDPKKGTNSSGMTPLHIASSQGHIDAMRYLLSLDGINVDAPTKANGFTPLHCICASGPHNHNSAVRLLLDKGADPCAIDKYGATPLHYASYQGKDGAVKILLEAGADPMIENHDNKTAKQYAANKGYALCYQLLESAEEEIAILKASQNEQLEAVEAEVVVLEGAKERQRAEEQERRNLEEEARRKQKSIQEKREGEEELRTQEENRVRQTREKFILSGKCSTVNFKVRNRTSGKSCYVLLAVTPTTTLETLYYKLSGTIVKKFPKEEHMGIKSGTRNVCLRISDATLRLEHFLVSREQFHNFTTVDIVDNVPESSKNPVHVELFSEVVEEDESLFDISISINSVANEMMSRASGGSKASARSKMQSITSAGTDDGI
eukprot:CAMPEP_0194245384 /NCGR_PEP_ID=MMETSP0158-20130606/13125_1 /TAXON_ID=33649 /ORGANISM="Thalassionema nitzschioides, Strain L26-B" /LENGTH=405 /DNA_ID=CAMNT_0038981081 /DNA_START=118 /DNA_END=1332 /DNA_ORIENTATION=-